MMENWLPKELMKNYWRLPQFIKIFIEHKKLKKREVKLMSNTNKALKYFAKYLKNYWKGVTIVIVLSLISTLSQVLGPLFLGNAVQELTKAVNKVASRTHDLSSFYQALGSMLGVYAAGRSEEHTSELQSRFD